MAAPLLHTPPFLRPPTLPLRHTWTLCNFPYLSATRAWATTFPAPSVTHSSTIWPPGPRDGHKPDRLYLHRRQENMGPSRVSLTSRHLEYLKLTLSKYKAHREDTVERFARSFRWSYDVRYQFIALACCWYVERKSIPKMLSKPLRLAASNVRHPNIWSV